MDIVSALAVLSPYSVDIKQEHLLFAGTFHPCIVPSSCLSKEQLDTILLSPKLNKNENAIVIALKAQHLELAWTLIDQLPQQQHISSLLESHIQLWIAKSLSDLKLPAHSQNNHIHIHPRDIALKKHKRISSNCWNTVRDMLSSLQWPQWHGPLLLRHAQDVQINSRPVLPEIHVDIHNLDEKTLSALLCELILLRYERNTQRLPLWIKVGLSECAKHKIDGGPSPRKMWRIRQQAGKERISALMKSKSTDRTQIDHSLAMACCAPLVHTHNKHRLESFLALLVNQSEPESALKIAYKRDIESLVQHK